jgi:hypothetical protein
MSYLTERVFRCDKPSNDETNVPGVVLVVACVDIVTGGEVVVAADAVVVLTTGEVDVVEATVTQRRSSYH